MSENITYNGWTNYATWRISLEIFGGLTAEDLGITNNDTYEVSQYLKDYCTEIIEQSSQGLAVDYALSFISDVNFYEIAEHLIGDKT
jgi:hypothetical protein